MTGSVTDSQAMSISYRYRENYHQVNAPTVIVTLDIDVLRTSRLKKRIVLGYVPVSENGGIVAAHLRPSGALRPPAQLAKSQSPFGGDCGAAYAAYCRQPFVSALQYRKLLTAPKTTRP
jgi:hypothetical protein